MAPILPPPSGNAKSLMEHVEDSLLPLINLVFLLLMFFIIAGKLADTPLPPLPAASDGQQQTPTADLQVQSDGGWLVNNQPVDTDALRQHLPTPDSSAPLRIAAHRDLSMSELERLLRQLEQDGYEEVILLTEPTP